MRRSQMVLLFVSLKFISNLKVMYKVCLTLKLDEPLYIESFEVLQLFNFSIRTNFI